MSRRTVSSRGRRKNKRSSAGRRPPETIEIRAIAQQGDGESTLTDGTRVYVPYTLPGDVVHVQPEHRRGDGVSARILDVKSSSERASPICEVFGRCGGCQLQHLTDADYVSWKTNVVTTALARQGIDDPVVYPMCRTPARSRRRATLALVRTKDDVIFGFNAAYSDTIVPLDACPLLIDELDDLIVPLRGLLTRILTARQRLSIAMTAVNGAVEIGFKGDLSLTLEVREAIAAFAERHDIARIVIAPEDDDIEPLIARRDLLIGSTDIQIVVPPMSFLQPSKEGEIMLQDLVTSVIGDHGQVADLFAGLGTFSMPLLSNGTCVSAFDSASMQIAALSTAIGKSRFAAKLNAHVRDLFADPLLRDELSAYDAVVFDPPRAGAKAQAAELASSDVRTVIAVSCNPSTMARDLRLLLDGGYKLQAITPIDQFPYSYHVEAVAILHRD